MDGFSARKAKTVIVLGIGRGGTSAIAGLLRELGVAMPNAHPLKHEWSPLAFKADGKLDLHSTIATINELNQRHDVWGWKGPGNCFLLDQFQSHLRNPVLVIVFRNFLDTCLSASRHGTFPWEVAVEANSVVLKKLTTIIQYSALPIIAIAYETLLERRGDVVQELNDVLSLEASEEMRHAAASFIGSKYNRLSFESHCGQFSADELAVDACDAQLKLFTSVNKALDDRIDALRADLDIARSVVRNLQKRIDRFDGITSSNRPDRHALVPQTTAIKERRPSAEDLSHAKRLAEAYKRKRIEYQAVVNERMDAQSRMDLLDLKLSKLEYQAR